MSVVFIIILSVLWSIAEIGLIKKDKQDSKGSVTIDKRTRSINSLAFLISLISPLFVFIFPYFNFTNGIPFIYSIFSFVIAILGLSLRYWAVYTLGEYFRTTVEIKKKQKIIQHGPYKYIRHPAYSGMILFFIGFGMLTQNLLAITISSLFPLGALLNRIKTEEAAFLDIIGNAYAGYKSKTKKLIPFIY